MNTFPLRAILAVAAVSLSAISASAATYSYTRSVSGTDTWSSGTGWSGTVPPVSGSTTTLTLSGNPGAGSSIGTTNNLSGTFQLNRLNYNYGLNGGAISTITIAGNPLQFVNDGATTPVLNMTNPGGNALVISNNVDLANNLTVTGAGNGSITRVLTTLSGVVSGTGSLTLDPSYLGAFTLAGANTYSGGTSLSAGALYINNSGAGGTSSALGTGAFTVNGGIIDSTAGDVTLSTNNLVTINGDFAHGGANNLNLGTGAVTLGTASGTSRTITSTGTKTLTIGGSISNGATATGISKLGGGNLAFTGSNAYTGATTFGVAGSTASSGTFTLSGANGSIANSSSLSIFGVGSRVILDNSVSNNNNRIANDVTLGTGAELLLIGNGAAGSTTESIGVLGFNGGNSTVSVSGSGAGQLQTLATSGFSRTNNSTALIRGTNLGQVSANGARVTLASTAGMTLVGTSTSSTGVVGTTKNLIIIPYILSDTSATGVGSSFATVDTVSGVRALGFNEVSAIGSAATGDNVRTTIGANTLSAGAKVFNSLIGGWNTAAVPTNVASSLTGAGGASDTLTLTSGALANVAFNSGGTLTIGGFSSIIFGTTGANEAIITNANTNGAGAITINSAINTFAAGGGLTKAGAGVLILTATNLYTGTTTINQGSIQIGTGTSNGLLDAASVVNVTPQGTLSVALANSGTFGNNIINDGTITKAVGSNTNTISGQISGGGSINVNLAGATLILSNGSNSFTGTATPAVGTLALGHADALRYGVLNTGAAAATRDVAFALSGSNTYNVGGLVGADDLVLGGNTLNVGYNNAASAYTGTISGAGTLAKVGTGTFTLSAANTFTGGLYIKEGVLVATTTALSLGGSGTGTVILGDSMGTASATLGLDARTYANTLIVQSNSTAGVRTITNVSGNTNFSGSVVLNSDLALLGGASGALTVSGVISGTGGLNKVGAGGVTLSSANTFTGTTLITEGILTLSNTGALQNSILDTGSVGSQSVAIGVPTSPSMYLGGLQGSDDIAGAAASTFVIGSSNISTTFAGGYINGAGSRLIKVGTGTLTMTGTSTFSGTTGIQAGTLEIGGAGLLGAGNYAAAITNEATFYYNSSADQVLSGGINGTGILVKGNTSTLTLTGQLNVYTGNTIIESGTLTLAGLGKLGGILNNSGSYAGNILNNGAFVYDNTNYTQYLSGQISGTGNVIKNNIRLLELSGSNTFSGTTTVNGGTLGLANIDAIRNSTLDTGVSGTQSVTFVVAGANTYNLGGLKGADALSIGANSINVGLNNVSTTYTGSVFGTGALAKVGTGTLTLTGTNTYTGTTSVNAGTLMVASAGRISNSSAVVVNAGGNLAYNSGSARTGSITLNGDGCGGGKCWWQPCLQ